MYQTVIESCNGRTAVDILGRSYFVASSAPVVPGKKIWTDGKIIYGNIAAGSSSYIPVTGDLIYVNHARELFVINGFQARRIGCAKNIIIGSRGNEFAILVDGKGYVCGDQKKADEYTLCAAVLENGDFMSVSVHPEDEKALCLHRKYCKRAKELKDKYQKVYGPLTINYPCNKWRWLEEPWPWERGNF